MGIKVTGQLGPDGGDRPDAVIRVEDASATGCLVSVFNSHNPPDLIHEEAYEGSSYNTNGDEVEAFSISTVWKDLTPGASFKQLRMSVNGDFVGIVADNDVYQRATAFHGQVFYDRESPVGNFWPGDKNSAFFGKVSVVTADSARTWFDAVYTFNVISDTDSILQLRKGSSSDYGAIKFSTGNAPIVDGFLLGTFPGSDDLSVYSFGSSSHAIKVEKSTGRTTIPILNLGPVATPASSGAAGTEGDVTHDSNYFYWYSGSRWNRVARDSTW